MSPLPPYSTPSSITDYVRFLGTFPEQAFDRLTRLAAHIFNVPIALLTLIADTEQQFKSCYGVTLEGSLPNTSFCAFTTQLNAPNDVLVVPDATKDNRFDALPVVIGPAHLHFYAGTPLRSPEGLILGTLCIFDQQPRAPLTEIQRDMLRELAAVVTDLIQQRLGEQQLQEARRHLEEHQRQIQLTLTKTRTALWTLDLLSGDIDVQADFQALGLPQHYVPTTRAEMIALVHPEDRETIQAQLIRAAERGGEYDLQVRLLFPNGQVFWTDTRGSVQCDDSGQPAQLRAVTFDRSEQHLAEQALIENEAILRQIIEQSPDAVYFKDLQGRYLLVNPAAARMIGRPAEEIVGQDDAAFVKPPDHARITAVDQLVVQTQEAVTYELPLVFGTQGELVMTTKSPFIRGGEVHGVIGVTRDITAQKRFEQVLRETNIGLESRIQERTQALKSLNDRLQYDALHDSLTGLPNRVLFMDRLDHAIQRYAADHRHHFAVLFLDFDRFKLVNDSLGHRAGDELLLEIAARLRLAVGTMHTVGRLGGDEFTVLLEDVRTTEEVQRIVEVLRAQLTLPFSIAGNLST